MNVWLLFAVFATPISIGAVFGVVAWWWPRHQLDRLFAERRRERVAAIRIPAVPEPLPVLEAVA